MQAHVNVAASRRAWTALAIVAAVVVLAYVATRIPRTLEIFVLAGLIALGVYPVSSRLERYLPRALAIGLVFGVLLATLVLTAFLIVPAAFAQIQALVLNGPDYAAVVQGTIAHLEEMLRLRFGEATIGGAFTDLQAQLSAKTEGMLTFLFASLGVILLNTANAFFVGISALVLSFFLLAQGKGLANGLIALFPPSRREHVRVLLHESAHIFGSFVAGEVILCAIVGIATWLCLLPLHFAFALLVAVLCGIGYAIPFVGMLLAQVIAAILAIPQGGAMVVWVSLVLFAIGRVADSLVAPKVLADAIGVSPIGIMFASFAGGEAFGLPGLLLGIPAAALVKLLFTYFVLPYIARSHRAEAAPPPIVPAAIEIEDAPLLDEAVVTSTPAL